MGQSWAECGCGSAGRDFLGRRVEELRCHSRQNPRAQMSLLCPHGNCKISESGSISPGWILSLSPQADLFRLGCCGCPTAGPGARSWCWSLQGRSSSSQLCPDICKSSNTKSSQNLGREPWQLWGVGQGGRGEQKRAAFLVPFIMGCNSCPEGVSESSFGFVLPSFSPSTTKP